MAYDFSSRKHPGTDVVQTTGVVKLNNFVDDVETAANELLNMIETHAEALTICTSATRPASPALGELIVETDTERIYRCDNATGPVWVEMANLYYKDVAGTDELHVKTPNDTEIQLTSEGGLNVVIPDPESYPDPLLLSDQAGSITTGVGEIGLSNNGDELVVRKASDGAEVVLTAGNYPNGAIIPVQPRVAVLTNGHATSFTSVDCSSLAPAGTKIVAVAFAMYTSTGSVIYARPSGSTESGDPIRFMKGHNSSMGWIDVGVDQTFEYSSSSDPALTLTVFAIAVKEA